MPTITRAKPFTKNILFAAAVAVFSAVGYPRSAFAEWTVDFSRRTQTTRSQDLREPASVGEMPIQAADPAAQSSGEDNSASQPSSPAGKPPGLWESLFQSSDLAQEIVVLNTDKGFIPSTIRVKKGLNYQIHVVNVNDKEKNVSFVLDSFSEHHATYYGKIKTFVIRPQKEGVYKFVSPETSAQGKLVVFPAGNASSDTRAPAAAE